MNKYVVIIIIVVLLIGGGFVYRRFFLPEDAQPVVTGEVVEITITAEKDTWRFTPEVVDVHQGDRVVLTIVNEDEYDHGIGIDVFGISQRMPAQETITIDFVVTQEGEFPFYCSVPCGKGEVDGVHRDHFDMIGKLKVQ